MTRRLLALVAVLILAGTLCAQSVTLPEKLEVKVGRLGAITVVWEGDDFAYSSSADLDVFREYDPDPKRVRLRIIGYTAGVHEIRAIACKDKKLSPFAVCKVTVGEPVPPKPPDPPGPKPPDPPDPPVPPSPSPIAVAGFRVLILYDALAKTKMPKEQQSILTSKSVRDYLRTHCATDRYAEQDGKAYRIWAADTIVPEMYAPGWKDAMKRPRASLPWILISNHPGAGHEGPLPADSDRTVELLKKYAEPTKGGK